MKNICFFVGNMDYSGGTERVSTTIINQLATTGFHVHVVNFMGGNSPFFKLNEHVINSNLSDYATTNSKFGKLLVISALRKYIISNKIDVFIAVESMLALFAIPATIFLSTKTVVWEHFNYNVDLGLKTRRMARHLAAICADHIVTLTEKDKKFWQQKTWCRAKIVAIANPVPFDVAVSTPDRLNKVFLAVGRLTYQKGFDLLLQSWRQVSNEKPEWRLQIVGSGNEQQQLLLLIEQLGLTSTVELIPATPNVSHYYQNASFYVMSSRFEGLPMVLLEAMSFGLPIVSFDCDTGPSDIILHEINGWLCDNSTESLAIGMLKAIELSNNESKYSEYSDSSKVQCDKFSLERIANKWFELLNN